MPRDDYCEEVSVEDHAMLRVPAGYHWKVWIVSGVHEPESLYWKVWFEDEVVNGGLADDSPTAHNRIRHYRFLDIVERFQWDRSNQCWVRK